MIEIQEVLKSNRYKKVRFKILITQHLLFKASINGVKGNFILDTGASNSCVDFKGIEKFNLKAKTSNNKASGAGSNSLETQVSHENLLQIGRWKNKNFSLVLFDMIHINEGLKQHKVKNVDGIIGADVLIHAQAIIDYANGCFYLQSI
jgi:hypothetical protein